MKKNLKSLETTFEESSENLKYPYIPVSTRNYSQKYQFTRTRHTKHFSMNHETLSSILGSQLSTGNVLKTQQFKKRFHHKHTYSANSEILTNVNELLQKKYSEEETLTRKVPFKPSKVFLNRKQALSLYEQKEILEYTNIYYIGEKACKVEGNSYEHNFGFDEENGDYKVTIGDHIHFRYEILKLIGKGTFGQVLQVFDHKQGIQCALKVIKNQPKFQEQAKLETEILQFLNQKDQEQNSNVVQMHEFFVFRSHFCITFELLNMNLYQFIRSNNYNGLSMKLIRNFTYQILQCLRLLGKHRIIHCDLKPENILLKSSADSLLRIIDFGASCFENQKVFTYIQSRFYRAPEVMLGIPYTTSIDMWSLGCIIVELATGFPLFPGKSEHQQMQMIVDELGLPSKDLLRRGTRSKLFFDSQGNLKQGLNQTRKLKALGCQRMEDFVRSCLDWDPWQRLTPEEALNHPWLSSNKRFIHKRFKSTGDSSEFSVLAKNNQFKSFIFDDA